MKITNEEALNIVLSLAQKKLNEIRVERVKKTNSMLESVEIIKYKKAMEIVGELNIDSNVGLALSDDGS